ncbi:alpha/beta hydrolase [Paracoccus benzoatiresistens]|uniref:Alpha/beta hydrolase-fold protein n=1 Tax=Paracoccus benzoatiresistens TaxID=2997341 RepID=A0ABT4J419_9RHOB|nr:alpha/beta hydrolase-fold protein [Paracoccus sp. EF6]MCZ0961863.1 alpha/beta hydrolase-fold protein [Paracoccus sp. EF6]
MVRFTRRTALAAGLAIPFLGIRAWSGTVHEAKIVQSEILGHVVGYSLYLPPDYRQHSRRYPVLYLLHGGADGQPADWFRMAGIDILLDRMIRDGQMPPCIAVAPDGRRPASDPRATYFLDDADGSYRWRSMFLQEFIPKVEAAHQAIGSMQMRALLGLSMGGHAAILNQLQRPDLFAGAAALSAALRTPRQVALMDPQAFDQRFSGAYGPSLLGEARLNEAWRTSDIVEIAARTDPTPFRRIPRLYLDLASGDPFFEGNAAAHVALDQAGILHRFQVREGSHDWIFWLDALPTALEHVGRIFTRNYGE